MTPTVRQWLDARAPDVPPVLMERIRSVVASVGEAPEEGVLDQGVQVLSRAVAVQMDRMRDRECTERRDALDLLTIDALVTYVLESAATHNPEALDAYAVDLMHLVGNAGATRPSSSASSTAPSVQTTDAARVPPNVPPT